MVMVLDSATSNRSYSSVSSTGRQYLSKERPNAVSAVGPSWFENISTEDLEKLEEGLMIASVVAGTGFLVSTLLAFRKR